MEDLNFERLTIQIESGDKNVMNWKGISDNVKPIPIPSPSSKDRKVPFLEANASARPRTIQFTTINGMNMPSFRKSG